jgi:hypothetical protein
MWQRAPVCASAPQMGDIAKPIVELCTAGRIGRLARPGLHGASGASLDLEPTSCGRKRGLYRDGEPGVRPRRRRRRLSLQERVLERVLKDASAQFEQDCARRHAAMVVGGRVCCHERSRGITVLVLMTRCYGTMPTTFALSVSLFDRFLEARASGEVQLDCFAGVATAGSSAPVERIQQLCAPLSCLMMAIKFLEVRAPALSDVVLMANRLCLESQARSPPGSPGGNAEAQEDKASSGQATPHLKEITTDDLREWEKFVFQALGCELNDVTSVDVLQGLVEREPSALAAVRDAAERKLKAAMCAPRLRQLSPIDLAVAALLLSADEGPNDHVTRGQVEVSLPSRLVSHPALVTTLSLLDQVLRHVCRHAQQ